MNDNDVLYPALALIGWTFVVLLLLPYRRFRAVLDGRVTADDFRFGESLRVPGDVSIPNRHLMNLLELPVLFYVVTVMLHVTQRADAMAVVLAWAYVALRALHSLVHLTYNQVTHRLACFAASNVVLAVLWARLLFALSR